MKRNALECRNSCPDNIATLPESTKSLERFVKFYELLIIHSPADLDDLEIAHVAFVADNIDIRYAHLALLLSSNTAVQEFAKTMIRDHDVVKAQALALLEWQEQPNWP